VTAETLSLELPAEPEDLRRRTLELGRDRPGEAQRLLSDGRWIADVLWRAWGPQLEATGAERSLLVRVARDYRLELWLWVVGERRWSQCIDGFAGRVRRRVHALTPTGTPDGP
jgi:hypothetical protein